MRGEKKERKKEREREKQRKKERRKEQREKKKKKKKKKKKTNNFLLFLKGARLYGTTYSTLIAGLNKASIVLDRKVLSELAMFEPFSFRAVTLAAGASGYTPTRLGDSRIILPKTPVASTKN